MISTAEGSDAPQQKHIQFLVARREADGTETRGRGAPVRGSRCGSKVIVRGAERDRRGVGRRPMSPTLPRVTGARRRRVTPGSSRKVTPAREKCTPSVQAGGFPVDRGAGRARKRRSSFPILRKGPKEWWTRRRLERPDVFLFRHADRSGRARFKGHWPGAAAETRHRSTIFRKGSCTCTTTRWARAPAEENEWDFVQYFEVPADEHVADLR